VARESVLGLKAPNVRHLAQDLRGAIDNVFIERLWRTLKYDHIHLNPAESGTACREGIQTLLKYYNEDRPHSSLDDQTPDEV
jgi:putative transposase